MPRTGVTYEQVCDTVTSLLAEGDQPTIRKIMNRIGGGSTTTIQKHYLRYRNEKCRQGMAETAAVEIPDEFMAAITAFVASEVATLRVDYERKLAAVSDDITMLTVTCENLEVERDALQEELVNRDKENALALVRLQELAAENNFLKAQQMQIEVLTAAVEKLSSDINADSKQPTVLDSHDSIICEKLKVTVAENDDLAKRLKSEHDRSCSFKKTITNLKEVCVRQTKDLDDSAVCVRELRDIVKSKSDSYRAVELRNASLVAQLDEQSMHVDHLHKFLPETREVPRVEPPKSADVQAVHPRIDTFDITNIFKCSCSSM